jgi:putative transposase
MIEILRWLGILMTASFRRRRELALENLALRQQLGVLKRRNGVARLKRKDRMFWVVLSRLWPHWRKALHLIRAETVVGWQRQGFRIYWAKISLRKTAGRPPLSTEIRALVKMMATANPFWGAPRIHGELLKLGIEISERTVSRLMPQGRKPSSQTWKAFLNNHLQELVSMDFFTVPTVTFRVLFVLVVLSHDRRRVIHFNVTEHPTQLWTAQQMIEAFPDDSAPPYLLRDRDQIYGNFFQERVSGMDIKQILTAPQSPWQSPFVERLIGSIRRDCLDHVIVLGEKHLRNILSSYLDYYHRSRTHLSLQKDAPETRSIQLPELGEVVCFPQVGGLHHRYERRAA